MIPEFRRGRASGNRRFVLPQLSSGYGTSSFSFHTVRDWNALPDNIRGLSSLAVFKRALLAHVIAMDAESSPSDAVSSGS